MRTNGHLFDLTEAALNGRRIIVRLLHKHQFRIHPQGGNDYFAGATLFQQFESDSVSVISMRPSFFLSKRRKFLECQRQLRFMK